MTTPVARQARHMGLHLVHLKITGLSLIFFNMRYNKLALPNGRPTALCYQINGITPVICVESNNLQLKRQQACF